jgi:hypothetical protein
LASWHIHVRSKSPDESSVTERRGALT